MHYVPTYTTHWRCTRSNRCIHQCCNCICKFCIPSTCSHIHINIALLYICSHVHHFPITFPYTCSHVHHLPIHTTHANRQALSATIVFVYTNVAPSHWLGVLRWLTEFVTFRRRTSFVVLRCLIEFVVLTRLNEFVTCTCLIVLVTFRCLNGFVIFRHLIELVTSKCLSESEVLKWLIEFVTFRCLIEFVALKCLIDFGGLPWLFESIKFRCIIEFGKLRGSLSSWHLHASLSSWDFMPYWVCDIETTQLDLRYRDDSLSLWHPDAFLSV